MVASLPVSFSINSATALACSSLSVKRPRDLLQARRAGLQPDAFGVMVVRARLGLVDIEVGPGAESLEASEGVQLCLQRIPLRV